MIKAAFTLKKGIKQNLDELLNTLNKYDGESLYLAEFNTFFISYLETTFTQMSTPSNKGSSKFKVPFNLAQKHPFIHVLLRIFESKTLQKTLKDKINTLLAHHADHPLRSFLELFAKVNRASNTFKEKIKKGIKERDFLIMLWATKFRVDFLDDISEELLKPLSRAHVTYASLLLFEHSVSLSHDPVTIKEHLATIINQSALAPKFWLGPYVLKLVKQINDFELKLFLLKEALVYECYEVLVVLATLIEKADHLGEKRYLEAYKYLVLAHFFNIPGAYEKLDEYEGLIKFNR